MARKDVTDGYISQDMTDANDNFIELYTYTAQIDALAQTLGDTTDEVIAARDGETSLLAKIDMIDLSIAALSSGSGVVVSANDTTTGFLNGKLVAGDNVTLTENNDGGNETLTVSVDAIDGITITGSTLTTATVTGTLDECIITQSKYNQIADASLGTGTHTFDYSAGDMQQLTATGDITLAFSNFPTGKVATMIIDAVNFGAHNITHPVGLLFEDGVAPVYTVSGTDRLQVIKDKDNVYCLSIVAQDIS